MDSHVLLSHRSKLKSHVAIDVADKRYISAVYFRALFLYTITKHKEYEIAEVSRMGRVMRQAVIYLPTCKIYSRTRKLSYYSTSTPKS